MYILTRTRDLLCRFQIFLSSNHTRELFSYLHTVNKNIRARSPFKNNSHDGFNQLNAIDDIISTQIPSLEIVLVAFMVFKVRYPPKAYE